MDNEMQIEMALLDQQIQQLKESLSYEQLLHERHVQEVKCESATKSEDWLASNQDVLNLIEGHIPPEVLERVKAAMQYAHY